MFLSCNFVFSQAANFTINNSSQCLNGNSFIFSNTSTAGATAYQWSFGDGSTSTTVNPTHIYPASGNYSVQLIATYAGINYYTNKTVNVNAVPQCNFYSTVATGTGNSYTFVSSTTIASGSMSYSWNFGDGGTSTLVNPQHTFANNGNYNVTLTVTSDNGCVCSTSTLVTATVSTSGGSGIPSSSSLYSFCVNKSQQCLTGNSFIFTNSSIGTVSTTYSWNFGDGTTSIASNPTKSYSNAGTYNVKLIATDSGVNYYTTKTIVVEAVPAVSISGGNCVGNTLTANVSNSNTIESIVWSLGGSVVNTSTPSYSLSTQVAAGGNGTSTIPYPVPLNVSTNQTVIPKGVYLDADKNLYVIDNYTSRLTKWANNSSGLSVASSIQLTGVGVDCAGNVYITDDVNNWVKKWTPGAISGITVAGGNGAGSAANQLDNPRGNIYIDAAGNIYINDTYNHRIQKWAVGATSGVTVAGGNGQGSAANQLSYPQGFFVDAVGNIYVSDNQNYRIQKWVVGATSGVTVAGGNGRGMGLNQFYNSSSVYVDAVGTIYVDDIDVSGMHRIQVWTNNAITGITVLNVNGSYPIYAIATAFVDVTNGDIYIADDANNRVVKYTTSNIANTYTPVTTGVYTVTATSFAGCTSTATTTVSGSSVTPAISITAGTSCQASICSGSSITFNAAIANGGTSPNYQWKVNGNNVGTNSSTFTTTSLNNNDIVTCVLTNSDACASPASVTSNSIAVTVYTTPNASITNNGCISGGLSISGTGTTGSSVTWLLAGSPVFTSTPTWDTVGVTVAGNLTSGFSASELNSPSDVFIDNNNNIYVCDIYNNRIQKFPTGSVGGTSATTVAGGNGNGYASNQLQNAYGFTLDATNNIYITNSFAHRIDKWLAGATSGTTIAGVSASYGNAANQFQLPKRMVLDKCGNMYIADSYNHRVQKFAIGSTVGVTVAGGNGNGNAANQLSYPTDVALDDAGNLYICDNENHRIQRFSPNSTSASNGVTVAGNGTAGAALNQLNSAWGFTVDGAGNLLIADTYNNRVVYWSVGATTGVKVAGGNGYGTTGRHFNYPTNVALDNAGNFYVADEHNNRVQKFNLISTTTFAPSIPGAYSAVVTNNSGCNATTNTVTIAACTVVTPPSPSFTTNTTQQCITGNNFVFTNTSTAPSGTTYSWSFGDGSSSTTASPIHVYTVSGYYNVQMIATYNGQNYYANSQSVYVGAKPVANFTQYYNSPLTYTFNSTSTISSGSIASYAWNFGDGGTGATSNPQHSFATAGTKNVKLIVISDAGCKDSITTSVVISSNNGGTGGGSTPTPSFIVNTTQQCIAGNSFVFTNTSTAPSGTTYLWNFGDGSTSTAASPTHVYSTSGYYYVSMIASYNGQNYYASGQSVVVGAKPVASFNTITGTGSGNAHTFISTSTIANGSMTYLWDFGDGATSTLNSPQHIFTSAGTINVKLVVTSNLGCKDSVTQSVIICPTFTNAAFTINSASSCFTGNYFGVQNYYGNNAGYPMTYLWNYGDGSTSTLQNPPTHSYAAVGSYNITLTTTLSYPGCSAITSNYNNTVTVNPMPVANFNISGSPTTMCYAANNYTFNNTTSIANGSMSFNWNFGDTIYSTLYSPTHSYTHAGSQMLDSNRGRIFIKLIATSDNNCRDSITKFITLRPVPIAYGFSINGVYGTHDYPLSRPNPFGGYFTSKILNDTIECFGGFNTFGHKVLGMATAPNDYWSVHFDDSTSDSGFSGVPGGIGQAPYHSYNSAGIHNFSGNMISYEGCISNTVYGHITITPNSDTMPHSVIGLHTEITTNVGVDPLGFTYNHYKLYFAHLGYSACRPIINTDWRFSFFSGNDPYWNHGYFDYGSYTGIKPLTSDSASFQFDADTSLTYQIRLITTNDLGMKDTAIAYFGATNSNYTSYRTTNIIANRNIGVYPNPANSEVKVAVRLEKNYNTNLYVYSSLGKVVLFRKDYLFGNVVEEMKLNVLNLPSGVYYIKLKDSNNSTLADTKFVKIN